MGPLGNGEDWWVECTESDASEGVENSLSSSPEEVPPEEESASASGTLGVGAPPTATRTVFTDF